MPDSDETLRDPAPQRSGPTVDDAVATAEEGTQVEGVHTPSGDEKSGDSRVERMADEPVTERAEGSPETALNPPESGSG